MDLFLADPDLLSMAGSKVTGLLTRTLTDSPYVKNVFPAHMRNVDTNDIVCVGEHYVKLLQLNDEGVTSTFLSIPFSPKIQAARVLNNVEGIDTSLGSWPPDMKSDDLCDPKSYSKDVLVLTLEPLHVAFLALKDIGAGEYEVLQHAVPLPGHNDSLGDCGRFLAIDPRSRAIAIGATYKQIMLLSLVQAKPTMTLHEEDDFVLQMEFLAPALEDSGKVWLAIVGVKDKKIILSVLSYDVSGSLPTDCVISSKSQTLSTSKSMR